MRAIGQQYGCSPCSTYNIRAIAEAAMRAIEYVVARFFFSSRRRHTRFDCDWSSDVCSSDLHIELTDRRDAPRDSCIVAEIPPPEFGDVYRQARADLAVVLRGRKRSKSGTLARPVEVQIVGAAFFDGNHRSRRRRRDTIDAPHGRCNASVSALWEIHPVYRVTGP